MKINRFEENLRKKLESIQPEFQEKDWQRMQSYMRHHAAPTFWQTHGQWIGYAAAASTVMVTTVLYFHQSNQNEKLREELTALKKTVGQQKQVPPPTTITKTDTVYIVSTEKLAEKPDMLLFEQKWKEIYSQQAPSIPKPQDQEALSSPALTQEKPDAPGAELAEKPGMATSDATTESIDHSQDPKNQQGQPPILAQQNTARERYNRKGDLSEKRNVPGIGRYSGSASTDMKSAQPTDIAKDQRIEIMGVEELTARPLAVRTPLARKLYRRMPPAQKDRGILVAAAPVAQPAAQPQPAESHQSERVLPDLPVPYRIGIGQQWEHKAKGTSFWSEILLGRHWSVSTGLTWMKPQEERYFNERIFHNKKRQDFRTMHGRRVPPSFEVFNITNRTTLLQLPISLNFRGELGRNFAYLIGAGTNINLRAKQELSFDLRIPTQQIDHWTERTSLPTPAFSNVQLSAGLEKRWNPIVVQAETYFVARNDARSYIPDKQSLGARLKILYEFGKAR